MTSPAPPVPMITQAWVLARLGRAEDALQTCHAALAADPGTPTLLAVCEVMRDLGAAAEALALLDAARITAPQDRGIDHLIGQICLTTGDHARAEAHLCVTLDTWPDAMPGLIGLTVHYVGTGRKAEALALWQRGIPAADNPEALAELGASYFAQHGLPDHARACLACADPGPDAPEAAYVRAALLGVSDAPICPPAYVEAYFNRFADTYDDTLARLGNLGPERVAEMIAQMGILPGAGLRVLDAGCGTGLCAPALRPVAAHLAGIDLSAAMLEAAAALGLYDHLGRGDLSALDQPGTGGLAADALFDLIVSSDVLVYFGVLDGVLRGFRARLRKGGQLVCTLEAALPDDIAPPGYLRHPSGRFRHKPDQVAACLHVAGFSDWQVWHEGVLRHEFGHPVPALLLVAVV